MLDYDSKFNNEFFALQIPQTPSWTIKIYCAPFGDVISRCASCAAFVLRGHFDAQIAPFALGAHSPTRRSAQKTKKTISEGVRFAPTERKKRQLGKEACFDYLLSANAANKKPRVSCELLCCYNLGWAGRAIKARTRFFGHPAAWWELPSASLSAPTWPAGPQVPSARSTHPRGRRAL